MRGFGSNVLSTVSPSWQTVGRGKFIKFLAFLFRIFAEKFLKHRLWCKRHFMIIYLILRRLQLKFIQIRFSPVVCRFVSLAAVKFDRQICFVVLVKFAKKAKAD